MSMIELLIERWSYPDGRNEFFWSLWRDGKRLQFGGRSASAEAVEAEGRAFCQQSIGAPPDRITRL